MGCNPIGRDQEALLATRGFKAAELDLRARGCPCVLVKSLSPQVKDSKWMLSNYRLTDLTDWDMRMLYTMAGITKL